MGTYICLTQNTEKLFWPTHLQNNIPEHILSMAKIEDIGLLKIPFTNWECSHYCGDQISPRKGYRLICIFDHSSCHWAYADNALNAHKMNAKPGGKQPAMRDTINPFTGRVQTLVFSNGTPKGLIQVLNERGIDTRMKLDDMKEELASHSDFREEKMKIEHYLNGRGHACILLPKFHCELNPIEHCTGQVLYTNIFKPHDRWSEEKCS